MIGRRLCLVLPDHDNHARVRSTWYHLHLVVGVHTRRFSRNAVLMILQANSLSLTPPWSWIND